MRAYALSEIGDRLAVDVFIRKENAWKALDDALKDEPQWAGTLRRADRARRIKAVDELAPSFL